jgi:hypothetical protein
MNNAKRLAHSIKAPPDEFAHHQRKPRKHTRRGDSKLTPFRAPFVQMWLGAPANAKTAFTKLHLSFFFIKAPNLAAAAD